MSPAKLHASFVRCGAFWLASSGLVWLSGCAVDAVIYRSRPDDGSGGSVNRGAGRAGEAGGAGGAGGAGAAGSSGGDPGSRIFGCGAEGDNANLILDDILTRLGSDLLRPDMPCTSDADCSRTFITPECDVANSVCVPCADVVQQTFFGIALADCLVRASHTCCNDADAAPDCIVITCSISCGTP